MADAPSDALPELAGRLVQLEIPAQCTATVAAAFALLREHAERVESFFVENPDAACAV
ncbi:MAG: hypothetical protein MT490_08055 [Sphingomonas sp.]|uniref:hypothetical protein n=1 Tax=Sphingomonas sp. TaxID=28214 RepID=UPI002275ED7A|nr:hypothetical protein [Sphingomonas sp.]MCX8475737.1 hypothetical protein [Sphingomonas sp.]